MCSSDLFGIKLYGSLDPKLVKPMADLAHKLGLRVHGHIPHGMRPLDASARRAGDHATATVDATTTARITVHHTSP